jgi:anaerobic selenocysteine-containing dehydrogenase
MTNTWQDIKNANVVIVMGGNAAEAHPCGFKWVIEAKIENGAKLVVVDPRLGRRLLRTDSPRHRHCVPEWRDSLSAGEGRHPA